MPHDPVDSGKTVDRRTGVAKSNRLKSRMSELAKDFAGCALFRLWKSTPTVLRPKTKRKALPETGVLLSDIILTDGETVKAGMLLGTITEYGTGTKTSGAR